MFFSKPTLKNLSIGMASSLNKDSLAAAKEAATQALNETGGKATFSIVYISNECDPSKVCEGINSILGTNWVGASVDKQILSKSNYNKDASVSVLCLKSDYLHFGVGVTNDYKKNPIKAGTKAIKEAMSNVKSDKYLDSYIQFTRSKTQDYSNIVRTPPYFIFTIIGSQTKRNGVYIGGEETNFLEGIIEHTGPNIPIFGLGSGYDFDKFLSPETKDASTFQFANGKVFKDAGVVLFVISNHYFEIDVKHGYKLTSDYIIVTKLDKDGFEILELNGKEPVQEYCRIIGVNKEEYLKNPDKYSLTRPFGILALDNSSYIKTAFPNPDGKTLHSTHRLQLNSIMNVLQFDKKSLFDTMSNILTDSKNKNNKYNIALTFFCNCSSRRLLMEGNENLANKVVLKKHKLISFFGCYAFSEIGSTKTNMAQVHGETVTSLIIFDNLLSD